MFAKKSIVLHTAHNNRPRNQRTATVIYKTSHRDINQKRNAMSVKKSIVLNIVVISTMFGSSLSLMPLSYLRYLCMFCVEWCPTHIALFLLC
jgi:hypothetical protein